MSQSQQTSEVIEDKIEEIRAADRLGDTQFSQVFHMARTSKSSVYSGVSVQVRVRDQEVDVHPEPVPTRSGEYLRGWDSWDMILTLPVQSFMETSTARSEIIRQLQIWQQNQAALEDRNAR